MKTPFSLLVDFRSFRWGLQPLHRKLRAELDAARFTLASLLREEKDLAETIRLLDAQFLLEAKGVLQAPLEPGSRARSLLYLVRQGQAVEGRRREASGLRSRITAAREACMAAERRLASAEKLRGKAQAVFAAEQTRIAAREADTAWLVGRPEARSVGAPDGGTP